MDKLSKFLLMLVIVLVFILVGVLIYKRPAPYYAVYLQTGELYFGKLSYFPYLNLSSVYLLQRTNNSSSPFSLTKFENSFWQPQGKMKLNSSKIVWMAKLKKDSQVVKLIKGEITPVSTPDNKQEIMNNEKNEGK